jgi:hypothetical protein
VVLEGVAYVGAVELRGLGQAMTPAEAVATFGESWERLAAAKALLDRAFGEALDAEDEGIARLLEYEADGAERAARKEGAAELRRAAKLIREVLGRRRAVEKLG